KIDLDKAASRGVLQDWEGKWISGYNRCLGKCLVFYAELWRILDGLNIMLSRNFENVLIQIDSMEAKRLLMIVSCHPRIVH
ncbi:hypothetical protein Goshw_015840, partial [Gossypium schwendimanii]|nr:hypothetical protein [Gossypium schwendimanii]